MSDPAPTTQKTPEQRLAAAAKKADREQDATLAWNEYVAENARINANTERLRELRLAKEAEVAATAEKAVEAPKKKAVRRKSRKADIDIEAV